MIADGEILLVCALAARCFGVFICLPFGETMNTVPRVCLSVAWGVALRNSVAPHNDLSALSCLWEFASGVLVGAPLRLVPDVAEMVGELIDSARGQTIASVNDPLGSQVSSDLASVCRTGVVALAVHLGAFEVMLKELRASYQIFPLGTPWVGIGYAESLAHWSIALAGSAFGIASAWLASFLMVDIVAASAARLVKGLQFSLIASAVKCLLTFILLRALLSGLQEVPIESMRGWLSGWHADPGAALVPGSLRGET